MSTQAILDPRLGVKGGTRYRNPKTGKLVPDPKEVTFKCKYCGETKPLDDMRTLTRFFPPVVVCRECEKKMG